MIKVYREDDANAVVIDDGSRGSGGMRFNNELRAIGNGDGTVSILSPTRSTATEDFEEVSAVDFADFTVSRPLLAKDAVQKSLFSSGFIRVSRFQDLSQHSSSFHPFIHKVSLILWISHSFGGFTRIHCFPQVL